MSMLHDALEHQVPCLSNCLLLRLDADSCSSRNKNNLMVSYLKDRVLLPFMLRGHTRFSADAGFGNKRTTLKKYDVTSLSQLMEFIVKSRSEVSVNFMEVPRYNFENLQKRNKDVSTCESLSEDDERRDKGYLSKRAL